MDGEAPASARLTREDVLRFLETEVARTDEQRRGQRSLLLVISGALTSVLLFGALHLEDSPSLASAGGIRAVAWAAVGVGAIVYVLAGRSLLRSLTSGPPPDRLSRLFTPIWKGEDERGPFSYRCLDPVTLASLLVAVALLETPSRGLGGALVAVLTMVGGALRIVLEPPAPAMPRAPAQGRWAKLRQELPTGRELLRMVTYSGLRQVGLALALIFVLDLVLISTSGGLLLGVAAWGVVSFLLLALVESARTLRFDRTGQRLDGLRAAVLNHEVTPDEAFRVFREVRDLQAKGIVFDPLGKPTSP